MGSATQARGGVRKQKTLDSDTMLMSAADLGRELGVSTRTIRRLDLAGKLPRPIHVGRAVRWRRAELVAWVAANGPPRDEWDWEPEGR